jgi:hypothetical protein
VAEGPPDQLGGRDLGRAVIRFSLPAGVSRDVVGAQGETPVEVSGNQLSITTGHPQKALYRLTA